MDVDSDSGFMATHEKPGQNTVKFYWKEVANKNKSREAGHPVCDWKEYIIILCPGQMRSATDRPATDIDKRTYPAAYQAFQASKEAPLSGTPISSLPGLSPSRAADLRRLHIFTVEQMAGCSDTAMRDVGMDFNSLKTAAAAFVNKGSPEVESLRQQVAELTAKLAELTKPKKPGRPRKHIEVQVAA